MKIALRKGIGFKDAEIIDLDGVLAVSFIIEDDDGDLVSLFNMRVCKDNTINIDAGDIICVNGKLLDNKIVISPRASNSINISKPIYED